VPTTGTLELPLNQLNKHSNRQIIIGKPEE
jgi:hypothetical protein